LIKPRKKVQKSKVEVATPFRAALSVRTPKINTIADTGIVYGKLRVMTTSRKVTVELPAELLEKAQEASGTGITQTIRTGLQLVAASRAYARLRQLRGKVRFGRTSGELKSDR
jgi:hypothetical protein